MKTTLQFNDEERHEAKMAIHASDLYCGLWNAGEEMSRLLNDRPDLEFTEKQDDALREIIVDMGERLSMIED